MIVFLDVIRLDTVTARVRTPSQSPANNYEGIIIMTTTGETARPLPLLGQAVGLARAAAAHRARRPPGPGGLRGRSVLLAGTRRAGRGPAGRRGGCGRPGRQ